MFVGVPQKTALSPHASEKLDTDLVCIAQFIATVIDTVLDLPLERILGIH
jgi:hypothetical protein